MGTSEDTPHPAWVPPPPQCLEMEETGSLQISSMKVSEVMGTWKGPDPPGRVPVGIEAGTVPLTRPQKLGEVRRVLPWGI